jgi:hypothetical protein
MGELLFMIGCLLVWDLQQQQQQQLQLHQQAVDRCLRTAAARSF